MRPSPLDDDAFKHNGLAGTFTYEPAEGALSGWRVEGSYALVDGRLAITELRIAATTGSVPKHGITGSLLRSVRPARFTDMIRRKEAGWLAFLEGVRTDDAHGSHDPAWVRTRDRLIDTAADVATSKRIGATQPRGRPRLTDGFLIGVARDYAEEVALDGQWRAVTRLAERHGRSKDTVKDWLKKARARGFYPPDIPIDERED